MKTTNVSDLSLLRDHLRSFGFIFQTSEIYGGLANSWDIGPLGVSVVNEIKSLWELRFVKQQGALQIDTKIILNPKVWEASGHLERFNDLLVEELNSKQRFRVDHLFESLSLNLPKDIVSIQRVLEEVKTLDGKPARWGEVREFRLLFESEIGTLANRRSKVYLRPETAQGVFVNFKNLVRSLRANLPLTVAQKGKAFRNEITPAHLLFRTREFEQLEYESFSAPEDVDSIFESHLRLVLDFLRELGFSDSSLRVREHKEEELAHYSKRTVDIEYNFPFGWGELLGIADRGDYDLTSHQRLSGEDMSFLDRNSNKRFIPHVVETSIGVERLLLALLSENLRSRIVNEEETYLLTLNPKVAPFQVAILPLLSRHNDLAFKIYQDLLKGRLRVTYDKSASIGKRYRRQDAIGTPFSITIDELSLSEASVTLRFRDSMLQLEERIAINKIEERVLALIEAQETRETREC